MDIEDTHEVNTGGVDFVRLEAQVDNVTDDESLDDVSSTTRQLYGVEESKGEVPAPRNHATPWEAASAGWSTGATESCIFEDKDEQEAEQAFYAELLAETPDGLDEARQEVKKFWNAAESTGLFRPVTEQSASTQPLPARPVTGETAVPADEAKFDGEGFKVMIEHSIRGLRITTDVEARVLSKVRKRCAEETKWVVPLANAVLDLPETRPEIRRMWQKLIAGLRTVMLTPADSSRASRFTMLRRAGRHEEKMAFVTQPAMEAAASAVFGDSGTDEPTPKAKRALVGVYLSLEDAMYKEFMSAVEDANIVNLRYPTGYSEDFDVHQDRAAVLYLVSGWVLSSAFAHVRRNIHDRLVFSPLLKAQKYADKNDFDRRAPESMRGVEKEVLRRSELEGKSLILVSSGFFTLVQRWEAGYRHAFSSPYLLATYMGNLPNEIKSVVGRAEAVELQWKRCVGATPEWFSNPSVEQSLYEILLDKYHILRFAEYCRRLVMASEPPKMDKAKQQAIHATLKARAGAKPEPQQANEGAGAASDRTAEDIARAKADLVALKLTRVSFNQLSVAQLRHHIENVGGRINGHIYATKTHLEMQLKYLVPGIISSEEEDEDLEDCDVRTATAVEALGGVYVESEW